MSGFVTKDGEEIVWDRNDPASLEAWFGNWGHAEHLRKVVLATARENERAKAVIRQEKVSEARLDDLARTSDLYVQWLIDTLTARRAREVNVMESAAR
jgi:hypothetical protein